MTDATTSTDTKDTNTSIDVSVELRYEVEEASSFAFSIAAARTPHQTVVAETIAFEPDHQYTLAAYGEAGSHQLIRIDAEPGTYTLRYHATAELRARTDTGASLGEAEFRDVPAEVLPYCNPSRYCESDRLTGLAERLFGDVPPGHGRVRAISDWVGAELVYQPGSTDASSSAADVLLQRAGVCRDYAHVAISLCRALGMPARYVSGYGIGVEPPDFHGFFEAYLGGEWWLFDPTGMARPDGLVRIGYGRDAADASFATFVGSAVLVDKVVRVAGSPVRGSDRVPPDGQATSTA